MIDRARTGDVGAFDELVDRYRSSARRVATVVLGTPDGAEDVVQDATLRTWRSIAGVDPDRGFRSWFLRAVANTARNQRRSDGRRASLSVRLSAQPSATPSIPEDAIVSDDERRTVIDALNRLGRDDRLVLALRHFEDLDEAEMAHVLGCPRGTVKSRLSRATRRLRDQLTTTGTLKQGTST